MVPCTGSRLCTVLPSICRRRSSRRDVGGGRDKARTFNGPTEVIFNIRVASLIIFSLTIRYTVYTYQCYCFYKQLHSVLSRGRSSINLRRTWPRMVFIATGHVLVMLTTGVHSPMRLTDSSWFQILSTGSCLSFKGSLQLRARQPMTEQQLVCTQSCEPWLLRKSAITDIRYPPYFCTPRISVPLT